jgi:hypothetical protein
LKQGRRRSKGNTTDNVNVILLVRPDGVAKKFPGSTTGLNCRRLFRDAALKMERWYDVKISFRDEKSKKLKIRAPFTKETIEEALAALREAFQIEYRISGRDIEIWSTKE